MEEVENDPEKVFFYVDKDNGRVMVIDSHGNLMTPAASPAPSTLIF
jgi:hypothetical protein